MRKHRIVDELTAARKAWGLTVEDLADLAGYEPGTLRKIEYGAISPSFNALTNLAQAMGYEISITPRGAK